MKLSEILKIHGLFANDIKARMKNSQIIVNGEIIKNDIELNIELETLKDETIIPKILEAGGTIAKLIGNEKFKNQILVFGIDNLMDCNIKSELTEILSHLVFVRTSKKDAFFLKKITNG
jgi:hypothetical protein